MTTIQAAHADPKVCAGNPHDYGESGNPHDTSSHHGTEGKSFFIVE
jgi:hypothetical protein